MLVKFQLPTQEVLDLFPVVVRAPPIVRVSGIPENENLRQWILGMFRGPINNFYLSNAHNYSLGVVGVYNARRTLDGCRLSYTNMFGTEIIEVEISGALVEELEDRVKSQLPQTGRVVFCTDSDWLGPDVYSAYPEYAYGVGSHKDFLREVFADVREVFTLAQSDARIYTSVVGGPKNETIYLVEEVLREMEVPLLYREDLSAIEGYILVPLFHPAPRDPDTAELLPYQQQLTEAERSSIKRNGDTHGAFLVGEHDVGGVFPTWVGWDSELVSIFGRESWLSDSGSAAGFGVTQPRPGITGGRQILFDLYKRLSNDIPDEKVLVRAEAPVVVWLN